MKISSMKIENFRGIGDCDINFKFSDSNIVIIYGPNGFGKTSIIDGIEWGLTGKIDHLEQLGEIDRKRFNTCQMINFYDSLNRRQKPAKVVINWDNGYTITRENTVTDKGDFNQGKTNNFKEEIFLKNVDSRIEFNKYFHTSHMLGQDTINAFLCSEKSKERANILFEILGLKQYLDIEKSLYNNVINYRTFITKKNEIFREYTLIKERIDNKKKEVELKLKDTSCNTYEEVIEKIKLYTNKIIQMLKESEEVDDIKVSIFMDKIKDSNDDEIKKYSIIIDEFQLVKESFEKHLNIKNKLVYSKKIKEQIRDIDTLYNDIELYNKAKYVENHLNNINLVVINGKYLRIYEKAQVRINKIILRYKEIKDKYLIILSDISEFIKSPIECREKLNKLSIELDDLYLLDKNVLGKYDVLKNKIKCYNNLLNEYTTLKGRKNELHEKKLALSSLNEEVKSFYSFNRKYIELHKKEIDDKCICPLCESILIDKNNSATEYILEKINKILEISNSNQEDILIALDNVEKEFSNKKDILETYKEALNSDFNNIFDIINTFIISKDKKINKTNNKIKENCILENEKIKSEKYKLNKVKEYLKEFNIESVESDLPILTSTIKERLNCSYKKVELHNICNYSLEELIMDISKINMLKINLKNYDEYKNNTIEYIIIKIKEVEKVIDELSLIYKEIDKIKSEIPKLLLEDIKKINKLEKKRNDIDKNKERLKQIYIYLEGFSSQFKEFKTKVINKYVVDNFLVHRIYSNINPHPIYKNITIDSSDGIIFTINNENRLQADYIFSSAQKNVLALSVFLGFALQQNWSKLDHIFIDDPIQNMDDINVVAFIDIIRSLFNSNSKFKDKTIVLTTHDQNFRNLLRMKCRNIKLREYEIISYSNNGPKIIERKNF